MTLKQTKHEWNSGAVVMTIASQQEGPGFETVSCLASFFVWYVDVVPAPVWDRSIHIRLISDSKLPGSISGCPFLSVIDG